MSAVLPETLDAARMIAARRCFEGELPLASMDRLVGLLVHGEGTCRYSIEFDRDSLGVNYVELHAEAELQLMCQRSLEAFGHPVVVDQRFGLVASEQDEAGLPPGYEALLLDDGKLHPRELIADELILAIPVVPVKPGSTPVEKEWSASDEEQQAASPFAALAAIRKNQ